MSAPRQRRLNFIPPVKGSFPLDHDGVCKDFMEKYMDCLYENDQKNSLCRLEIKNYLDCRMKNELMAKEPWSKLGFSKDEFPDSTSPAENTKMSAAAAPPPTTTTPPPDSSMKRTKKNILLGCTGSVAALKIPVLVKQLLDKGNYNIKVIATENSKHFFNPAEIAGIDLLSDADEWTAWNGRGDPVMHIELCKWADVLLIAPLDANTLGKLAGGLCDNLLTCVARAWEMKKPFFFCPAMNTKMYEHPITAIQISTLRSWGYIEIPVISKLLVCGDTGMGAMAEVDTIVQTVVDFMSKI